MTTPTAPASPDLKFAGFVFKAPLHTNPTNTPNRYGFSGVQTPGTKPLKIGFTVLHVPGFVTPDEFAADIAASDTKTVHGTLTLFGPDYRLGRFNYRRADGSEGSAEASDLRSITLDPPSIPRPTITPTAAPKPAAPTTPTPPKPAPAPKPPEPPAPKPRRESPGMDMTF